MLQPYSHPAPEVGWTSVMRRLGCSAVAEDRSEVDPVLMRDDMVDFVKGDAYGKKSGRMLDAIGYYRTS